MVNVAISPIRDQGTSPISTPLTSITFAAA